VKILFLSTLIIFGVTTEITGQIRKTTATKSKNAQKTQRRAATADSDGRRVVLIQKWGLASVSVPKSLTEEPERIDIQIYNGIKSTSYSRNWKKPREDGMLFYYTVNILVTTKDIAPGRNQPTPETLLRLEHEDNESEKTRRNVSADEVGYLELDGLRGSFHRFQDGEPGNDVNLGWTVHRYYKKKMQKISVWMSGKSGDLPEMMSILHSVKFDRL
jgi:hypothetical protein